MTLIAGASQYLTQSALASKTGSTFSQSNVLGETLQSSLLDVGRGLAVNGGPGLSGQARYLNNQQASSSAATYNQLFSLSVAESTDALMTQILGIRASLPASKISSGAYDASGSVTTNSSDATGTSVDESV